MGSLRGVRNFDGITVDPSVNILFVLISDEQIDEEQIEAMKEFVSTTKEGGFMIIRHCDFKD